MITLSRDEMRGGIILNVSILVVLTFVQAWRLILIHQNHATLYPVPAKWDHINSPLQLCCQQTTSCILPCGKYNAHW